MTVMASKCPDLIFNVVDINKERINQLKNCFDKTMELDVEDKKYIKLINLTTDIQDIYDSDVFIVTVPTPIDASKNPILEPLKSATTTIANALLKKHQEDLDHKKSIII